MNAAALLLALVLPAGGDAFVVTTARLRSAPSPDAKLLGRLAPGVRVEALGERNGFVGVAVDGAANGPARGFVARGALAAFPAGAAGTREMAAAGRFLAQDPDRRPLALALLARADERLRCDGARDAALLVALGETEEAAGLPAASSFREAAALLEREPGDDAPLRDRARSGVLRAAYPKTSGGLVALWRETTAWLEEAETAREAGSLALAASRLSASASALGRLLLAANRPDDLAALSRRVEGCATRLAADLPDRAPLLDGTARLLVAMRGDGTAPFPQRATWGAGPAPLVVAIDGSLGALALTVRGAPVSPLPVLPVPGSLRLAPDGATAAWLEVATPTTIVPVVARLDGSGGDATLLAGGRPGRERNGKRHVLATLRGFSRDGKGLLVAVAGWDDEPPPVPRLALVDTRTAALAWEGSARRAAEARRRLGYRPARWRSNQ